MALSIVSRLFRFFRASAHDGLDVIEGDRVGSIARQTVRDLETDIARTQAEVTQVVADQKVMQSQKNDADSEAKQWADRAERAVKAARDDLALGALERAAEAEAMAAQLGQSLAVLDPQVARLRDKLDQLRRQRRQFSHQADMLSARATSANARKRAAAILGGRGESGVALDDLSGRVDRLEAHADAALEIAGSQSGETLESEIEKLSVPSADERLAEIKARIGATQPAGV